MNLPEKTLDKVRIGPCVRYETCTDIEVIGNR